MKKTLALIIMDGFGIGEKTADNAIFMAKTPTIDNLMKNYSHTEISASGLSVGLPNGQMGNSEVGHTNIGAGRIVYQSLTRITKSINDGDFFTNTAIFNAMENAQKNDNALHIMGLLSDGGVHSHIEHLFALLKMAKNMNVKKVFIHAFTDGRDVSPTSAIGFIKALEDKIAEIGIGKIATVSGRYYAMDRDNRFERLALAYNAMTKCEGEKFSTANEAITASYDKNITDEFIIPSVINGAEPIKNGDSVVFFNFRPDRAREITKALVEDDFIGFGENHQKLSLDFVCMTEYDHSFKNVQIAYAPEALTNTLGEFLSNKGLTQLRIAETEKYAHVTFFFNGGQEISYKNEDRILVNSPKVATYDLQPEMSAFEVTEKACEAIKSGKYDVMILNFANCDMVGHTGIIPATIKACETVDSCLNQLLSAISEMGGSAIITADHGNADQMLDENNAPFTQHSTNPVPLFIFGDKYNLRNDGVLADIAPTILEMLNLEKPKEMSGNSLILS